MPNSVLTAFPTCPTSLSDEQIAQYQHDGFIPFHDVLSPEEVEAAKASFAHLIENLRREYRVSSNGYGGVWTALDSSFKIQFQHGHAPSGADDPELELKVRKFHDFVGVDPHLTYLMHEHPKIQGVLSSLIGADPIPSQDMALLNPPLIGTGKPWHQDDAYFKVVPLDAVCGVWIALDEAGLDNGCMHFLPGWHKKGALRHFHGRDCEIAHDRVLEEEQVPVPLPPGGAVFFSGILPHQTYANTSNQLRRAVQYHYRSRDSRIVEEEEYDAIFIEADGSPASCSAAAQRGF
jgi:phytanoyl-CoA hydroxylase